MVQDLFCKDADGFFTWIFVCVFVYDWAPYTSYLYLKFVADFYKNRAAVLVLLVVVAVVVVVWR